MPAIARRRQRLHLARSWAFGALRLALAASFFVAVAYVLSWQLLWEGMAGSEAPFHLHLIEWVASPFPNLPWWYPWDGMGVSFREGYPLAAHWVAVALSRLMSLNLEGGAQVVQFTLMPATATGLYAFFDWRIRRPLIGMAAGLLFLLSPIGWVEWTHFGLYASWVGMVFFLPSLIALDAFFFAWLAGDRGWRFRLSAALFVALTTAMGVVSPHILAAPLMVAVVYAVAVPRDSARRAWTWLLVAVPALYLGIVLLSAFWLGAEIQYLAVVRSHWAGAGTNFDAGRLSQFDLGSILSLHPIRDGNVNDLYSVSPAVLLPAILAIPLAWRDARARMFLAVLGLGLIFMAFPDLFAPLFVVPGFKEFGVVVHRPFQLLLAVAAPALGAVGIFEGSAAAAGEPYGSPPGVVHPQSEVPLWRCCQSSWSPSWRPTSLHSAAESKAARSSRTGRAYRTHRRLATSGRITPRTRARRHCRAMEPCAPIETCAQPSQYCNWSPRVAIRAGALGLTFPCVPDFDWMTRSPLVGVATPA